LWALLVMSIVTTAHAQRARSPKPVTVVNTPLPVTATLTGNIRIAGTASMRDVDASARNGFNAWVTCTAPIGSNLCRVALAVGADQMAVIESIGADMFAGQFVAAPAVMPSGQIWAQSPAALGSAAPVVNLKFTMDHPSGGGFSFAMQPLQVRIYASRLNSIELQGFKPTAFQDQEATFSFNITGYVLPCGPAQQSYDCPAPN
jgi:hypothetical protein